jgi:hypothetical protein
MSDLAALAENIPSEVLDYIDEVEEARDTAVAKSVELQTAIDEGTSENDSTDTESDPIAKALGDAPAELVQLFKSQAERLDAAESDLAASKESKENGEWVAKARSFDGLVDPETFGPALRAIATHDSELADMIATALETATGQIEKSRLFDEFGHGSAIETEAADQISAIAKADGDQADETARAEAWESNPELYDQYVAERRDATRSA